MKYILLLLSFNSFAISIISKKPVVVKKEINKSGLLKEQLEYYKNKANTYKKLSEINRNNFDLRDDFKKFRSGDMIKGHLFNYVLSTNLNTPIIVIPESDKLPQGSKILCEGRTFRKRVAVECTKIVTPVSEFNVSAILLSEDGSFGLVGEYNDGRDYELANNVVQGAMANILESQRDLINTDIGLSPSRNPKNQIIDGVVGGVLDYSNSKESNSLPSVFLESNLGLIIYFK